MTRKVFFCSTVHGSHISGGEERNENQSDVFVDAHCAGGSRRLCARANPSSNRCAADRRSSADPAPSADGCANRSFVVVVGRVFVGGIIIVVGGIIVVVRRFIVGSILCRADRDETGCDEHTCAYGDAAGTASDRRARRVESSVLACL